MIDEATRNNNRRPCAPKARCHRWRICPACAAIRQAQIADLAEQLAEAAGPLEYSVLHPSAKGAAAIADLRAAWVRKNRPAGAIWTIEKGASPGALHLNILHPAGCPHPAGAAEHYREQIRTTPRTVAAYISKPTGYPEQATYPGRILGRSGPLWQYLLDHPSAPYLQAAVIQHIIEPISPAKIITNADNDPQETARRWLPAFAELLKTGNADRINQTRQSTAETAAAQPRQTDHAPNAHPYERRHQNDTTPRTAAEAAAISAPHLARMRQILNGGRP